MIQGILTFQYNLNQNAEGEIQPEFKSMQMVFNNEKFNKDNYSEFLVENDIFALFYEHSTGLYTSIHEYSNFYTGRLNETPYQVISYFKQFDDATRFLAISIFDLYDELELFEPFVKNNAKRLDIIFKTLLKARDLDQLSLLDDIFSELRKELSFTIFQIERLSQLDKLQRAALIFNSDERIKILEILRERPISKRELKTELEKIKVNPNLDLLIDPLVELNLIRRDWIKGKRDKRTGRIEHQGEFLFLTKDIVLSRIPHHEMLEKLKGKKHLYRQYKKNLTDFFSNYDLNNQKVDQIKKLASIALTPDYYDVISLLRKKYYPRDKMPKIISDWADINSIIEELKSLNIITEIPDENNRNWIILLTDIEPLVIFPEFLLPKIREAYQTKSKKGKITFEIAKKALELLEITYTEKIEF